MKYAVDRIVEEIVVLENIVSGEIIEENIKKLPKDIHEGSIVVLENDNYSLDVSLEKSRKENLKERLERLKNLKK